LRNTFIDQQPEHDHFYIYLSIQKENSWGYVLLRA